MSKSAAASAKVKNSKVVRVQEPSVYQSVISDSAKTLIGAIESQMDKLRQQIQFLQGMVVPGSAPNQLKQPKSIKAADSEVPFAERAVNFLKSNGPSKASAVIRAFGLAPNSATVRMQQLREKGVVSQDKKTKLWSAV